MTSYQKPTVRCPSRLRCLSIAAGCLHITLASALILGQGPEEPFPARQNPVLRQYFRKQFYETRVLPAHRLPSTSIFLSILWTVRLMTTCESCAKSWTA